MVSYISRRFLYMLILLVLGSVVSFLIIVLPPGDYLTSHVMRLEAQGSKVSEDELASLRLSYGLDQPVYVQYLKWAWKVLHGDLGYSFQWSLPVHQLIGERLGNTILITLCALLFTYAVAIPVGIYSATHQYSVGDYVFTIVGFVGVAVPSFLLALVFIVILMKTFGISAGGLISVEFKDQPWSWAKALDLLKHLPLPIIVIGTSGTASLIRVMRGVLLDEINKPYVATARAKGLKEVALLAKYPVRVALNPIASSLGWALPAIFSGQTIVSIVLNLPTVGPLLFAALMQEDMFLAASVVLINTALTAVGMLLSDMLLAWLDPRIRLGS